GVIGRVFLKEYARNKHLEPTAIELAAMKRLVATKTPTRRSSDRPLDGADSFESSMILVFKLNRFLWNKHGGRVVHSMFGPTPTEAMLKEIELLERQGNLHFESKQIRDEFIERYTRFKGEGTVSAEATRAFFA